MSAFRESRNVELSVIKYLTDNLAIDWSGITVVKSFQSAFEATIPVVCIRLENIYNNTREIGSTTFSNTYEIYVDIFARSDGQRIDIADYIADKMKDGCTYYTHTHTSGSAEALTLVADGRVQCLGVIENTHLPYTENDVDIYDKYRHFIVISVRKST